MQENYLYQGFMTYIVSTQQMMPSLYINKHINLGSLLYFKQTFYIFNLYHIVSMLIPIKDLY